MALDLNNLKTFYNALIQKFKSYRSNWEQNDPTADNYIKNRPFYEETKIVNEPFNFAWNGHSDEYLCIANCMYKISDLVLTDEQIKSIRFIDCYGESDLIGNSWDDMKAQGFISENSVNFYYYIIFNRNYNTNINGTVFPEPGIYVYSDRNYYIMSITSLDPIERVETIIHKLDKKFIDIDIPDTVGSFGTGENAEIFNYSGNIASGYHSHAEGSQTEASGETSHAEGADTIASGTTSHAEGGRTVASGWNSHAEGYYTTASGDISHAEGSETTASGFQSHAEGYKTKASGDTSHTEGFDTIAGSKYQHVQGKWNIEDTNNIYNHIVGNGTHHTKRSNAHTLDWEGNAWYQGDVYVGSTSGTNKDEGSQKLATEEYVDSRIDQCVKVEDMEVTETFTWDLDTRDRYYLINGDISYYKVSDKNIDVKDIISFTVISNTQSFPEDVESGDGYHIEQGIAIFNKIGIVTTSAGKRYNIQSPGIYFGCSTEKKVGVSPAEHYAARGITKASITYKADSIHSDIVGIVRSVNGITPDTDGNVELTVLDDANKYTDEQIATHEHSWNDLKDKPFYEETEVVNEPLNITWDGNTEGLLNIYAEENPSVPGVIYSYHKVSDLILTEEQIKLFAFTTVETPGEEYAPLEGQTYGDLWEEGLTNGSIVVTEDLICAYDTIFVRRGGGKYYDLTFPESGIYFSRLCAPDGFSAFTNRLYSEEPIEQTKTVVHKLDKKYLPDDAGGAGEKAWLIYSPEDDGVNFVIAEWDPFLTATPVIIEWDTLKTMTPNEIMRRLIGLEGTCREVYFLDNGGDEYPASICVCIVGFMAKSYVDPTKLRLQYSYYNITRNGIEFYGRTVGEDITLVGGTLQGK